MSRADQNRIVEALVVLLDAEHVYRDPDLTVDAVATRVGASTRNLSRIIAAHFGCSFPVWLNSRRVRYAAEQLLARPDRSVIEIMYEAGFGSKSTFHREFTRVFSVSPTAYREGRGAGR